MNYKCILIASVLLFYSSFSFSRDANSKSAGRQHSHLAARQAAKTTSGHYRLIALAQDVVQTANTFTHSDSSLCTFTEKESIQYRLQPFFDELLKDIFFTFYISKDQLFSSEFADFIKIFEKYVQQIEGINFTVDNQSSPNGNTFYLKSTDSKINNKNFSETIKRFNDFMDLCANNPDTALQILNLKFNNSQKAIDTLQIFSRKYSRLMMDINHQKERLDLMIKQDIENAFIELDIHENTTSLIINLDADIRDLLKSKKTYNDSYIAHTNSYYTKEEKQIIELANEFGNTEEMTIVKSNVERLKDSSLNISERKTSAERIKHFLLKVGKKTMKHAEDISIKVLTSYIENQLKKNS